jgi:outer membrane cobalamin receptor
MDRTRTTVSHHPIAARLVMSALLALASGGVPVEAAAQAPSRPDSVVRVPPLRVDAVRTTTTAGAASALLVDLDSLRPAPAATLEQVLRELPLVTVRTNSRGEAQFSLRGSGSDARQVAVLIDGIPLHVGWDDRVDLSVMSAGAASNLTLVRGLPSILHGPNVLGGVVEMAASSRGSDRRAVRSVTGDLAVEQTGAVSISGTASIPGIGTVRVSPCPATWSMRRRHCRNRGSPVSVFVPIRITLRPTRS